LKGKRPPLTSRTKILGVIGDPIEHSLSPIMHNYVLDSLGLDYRYLAFHVRREEVGGVGQAFRTLGLAGLNVTIPHKEAVLGQMEHLTPEAEAVEAVNTIGMDEEGRLVGHNTDIEGFRGSLRIRGLDRGLAGNPAVVLGAGGAARAVLYALAGAGAGPLVLANRTTARAEEIARWCVSHFPKTAVEIVFPSDRQTMARALEEAFITVNVTPVGMAPNSGESPLPREIIPRPGSVVYDTIYNPSATMLLQTAAKHGCSAVGGLDMLIIQGMESLSWWLGQPVPWAEMIEELRQILKEALARQVA